ncbi:MAG: YceI family protein [Bacteroidia bacterium]|nr:YceI family protein [Bacteroidia bacterium]
MSLIQRIVSWLGFADGKAVKSRQLERKAATFPRISTWELDPFHTTVGFRIMHMGLVEVSGRFKRYTASVKGSSPDFSDLQVEVQVEAASIDTDLPARDAHLRSPDFLDVERYPHISFRSTAIRWRPLKRFVLEGDLMIKGVTHRIRLEGELKGLVLKDIVGQPRASFTLTAQIDRRAWGLTWHMETEDGSIVVDPIVNLEIAAEIATPQSLEALRQMAAQVGGS